MALRDRLRRLQRLADEELTTLVCGECGEEIRVSEDADLALLAHQWAEGASLGATRQTPPDGDRLLAHPCGTEALVEKRSGKPWPLADIGGGRVGLTR